MAAVRFIGMAFAMFLVVFFGMKLLPLARPLPVLKPDARIPTIQQAVDDLSRKAAQPPFASDGDATRDRLRNAVLEYAKALGDDTRNKTLKTSYVEAATAYARAWLSIAPCVATRTCSNSDRERLDRAQDTFDSPLDHRVREAMRKLHSTGVFGTGDFAKDVVTLLSQMANDPRIDPRASTQRRKVAEALKTPAFCVTTR